MKTLQKMSVVVGAIIFTAQAHAVMYLARPYEPNMGRWLARDPIGERGGKNLYGMVNNDPVNHKDYLGFMKVCCDPVRGNPLERQFIHCHIANNCESGMDAYEVWVDTSETRKLDNGKSCKCATASEIEECLRRHPYDPRPRGADSTPPPWLPWPLDQYDKYGNNCQTSVILSLGSCCLKSNWRPNWYAGDVRGNCIRGHQVAVGPPLYYIFVCDEWELPDWTDDVPPSDVPPEPGPTWPNPLPTRP